MATDLALNVYKQQLANMTRNKNRKGQYAPHKPILLLSIIDLVEVGKITSDLVELTPLLCKKFKELWDRYVPNGIQFNPDITKPSPSMAAIQILGRPSNGWTEWKNKDGKTLDEIYRKK